MGGAFRLYGGPERSIASFRGSSAADRRQCRHHDRPYEFRLSIRTQSPFLKGPMARMGGTFWEIGLPAGLPPPRPPRPSWGGSASPDPRGPGASGANGGGPEMGAAAFGRRPPPILGTLVGAGGARSGGSGGREPPRKATVPNICYALIVVHSSGRPSTLK